MAPARSIVATLLTGVFIIAAGVFALISLKPQARQAQLPDLDPSPDGTGMPVYFAAPDFSLTDENSRSVSSALLAGHPYVAAFIFTNCTSTCPMLTGRMARLQEQIPQKSVRLVSFTVDPVRDTAAVLKGYATKFQADESRWFFLTGSEEQMHAVENGFHVRVPRPEPTDNNGPEHSDRFLLVDGKGQVRGVYDSKDEVSMARLKSDSARLE